jgi:hypothetical protein
VRSPGRAVVRGLYIIGVTHGSILSSTRPFLNVPRSGA